MTNWTNVHVPREALLIFFKSQLNHAPSATKHTAMGTSQIPVDRIESIDISFFRQTQGGGGMIRTTLTPLKNPACGQIEEPQFLRSVSHFGSVIRLRKSNHTPATSFTWNSARKSPVLPDLRGKKSKDAARKDKTQWNFGYATCMASDI